MKMAGNRPLIIFAFFSVFLNLNVSAVYFPMQTINLTLPDIRDIHRPLPPVLTLHAVHDSKSDLIYGLKGGSPFQLRRNKIQLREDRPLPMKTGHQQLKVFGKVKDGKIASAIINIKFTDRRLVCEELTKEMCFWLDGNYRVFDRVEPMMIGYLSSEFLLTICSNYSLTYRVLSGEDYFEVSRMSNTNAYSWILSLLKTTITDGETTIRGEVICSASSDNTPPRMHKKRFEVNVASDLDLSIVKKVPKDLEIMSLVVPEEKEMNKMSLSYPDLVEISRYAQFASRVMNAEVKSLDEIKDGFTKTYMRRIVDSGIKFRIEPDDVFGVTEEGGIAYVRDPVRIRNATSFRVRIVWIYPKGFISEKRITIRITDTSGGICEGKIARSKKSCSQKTSEGDCLKTCGIGAGLLTRNESEYIATFGCQWRKNEKPEELSSSYRTCSPNLTTCPDRFCDPLERMFPEICPQDCTDSVYGSGNKEMSEPGIASGSGVCSCSPDGEACTCGLLYEKKSQGKGRKFHKVDRSTEPPLIRHSDANISVVQAANSEQCGIGCLSFIVGGTVLLVLALSTVLMIIYHRRLKKRCPNQGPLKEDMININYEEYIDRSADGLRVPPHNPVLHDKPEYYDKKWEFPRYRLIVEETIGEGEFGKVLKGRAEGIGGIDGPTVVAVKTLKENARDSELNDLISEYQLLKEVDHPNIIHLLGACTTLDGPLYIIIEYAKYGSLRNYLRRNRHLGSDLHLNDKESETSYMQSITPKDILTFAWQIAKGMAYLTEMKLVHRDLAARNVLVAEGLICKISDFGLTRDIYEDDTYLKRSKGRVPVKWMALESLSDHLYTTKSDVWSYGIVLWELVTTGSSPYPGIAVQNLFHLLKNGYRMERPVNCSPELYHILRSCWHENPSHRPTFKALVSKLEEMLGEGKDYLDLNPRIIENKTYFSDFPGDLAEEEESFLPGNCGERRGIMWRFDFSEAGTCGCPEEECSCPVKPRYENENLPAKPKYENDGVEESSYVQPKREPKRVNSAISQNLHEVGDEKICESKRI